MHKINLCVNTQTPLVRFKLNYDEMLEKYGFLLEPLDLKSLIENEDYQFSPGGVAGMVFSMLQKLMVDEFISSAKWVSLNPNAPPEVYYKGIHIYNVQLPNVYVRLYANFKETIWKEVHGLGGTDFRIEEYEAYATYNWLCAQKMLELLPSVDLFWVHDFQQLQVGSMIGPAAPVVFRWHIPFKLDTASPRLREFIMRNVESYDAVIVSTKRDLEGLIHAGYRGKAYQIYPYIDPEKWGEVEEKELEETLANFGIQEDDEIILVVARMDRIKGQDIAVKAFSLVRKKHPHAKLFLVGDGSFTSSGLGHSKGENWRRELKKTAQQLKVEDFVNFLGYVEEKKLKCLYSRADVVLLPSIMEGFGLTVVEAWNYMKPVVVSKGAGVSELILEKVNGLTHEPQNYEDLAEKIDYVLEHKEEALKMGQVGYETAKQCSISGAMERLKTVFETVLEKY